MKEYFIAVDGQQKGAFSLKDLKHETVLPDTLIWKEGWAEWKTAKAAVADVPEIELIINDTPPIPQEGREAPKSKKNLLTTLAKASEGDLSSIGSLVGIRDNANGEEKAEGEQEPEETAKEKPSFMSVIYYAVGEKIDNYLAANTDKISSSPLLQKIDKARTYFKGLNPNRRRSFNFFISAAIVFLIFWLILFSVMDSFWMVCLWATVVALNQIKFIDNAANQITNLAFLLDFGLMPAGIKQGIASGAKFLLFLIIGFFASQYIGLPYLIYRIVIAFIDPDNLPNFEK